MEVILYWHWLIIGLAFLVLEIFAPGAILMWFGFAGIMIGGLVWLFPDLPAGFQIIIFSVFSLLSIFLWRVYRPRSTEPASPDPELNNRLNAYIGHRYTLKQPINSGRGRLQVGDATWVITGPDLEAGEQVEIVAVKGISFVVARVE